MRLYLLFAGMIFLSSCVSNKKITFLQKGDMNAKNLPKDTVVRTYAVDTFQYKIQTNDILSVRFESLTPEGLDFFSVNAPAGAANLGQGNPLLIGELVDENGEIPFPVIGKVKVEGFTIYEVQDRLQELANQYIEAPIVKVRLLNYRVTILGEVNFERTVTLNNNRVSIFEAIGLVEGLSDIADRSNVKIIRQNGAQFDVQYVNLLDENFINSPYYYVHQNDIIVVPPLKQRPFRKYFGTNLAAFVSLVTLILVGYNLSQ